MRQLLYSISHHRHLQRPGLRQFVKFSLVGVVNTFFDFLVFSALVYLAHVPYLWANGFAFILAVMNSYWLNRRWTFRSQDPRWLHQLRRFMMVSLIGFGLSELTIYLAVQHFAFHTIAGKMLAIAVALSWNYWLNRRWTFRHRQVPMPPVA